jgi:putative ABC transport system substrate-binding protein
METARVYRSSRWRDGRVAARGARAAAANAPVIGFLNTRAPGEDAHVLAAFHQGLTETGYVEGRNVAIEYRWAEGHNDRLPALAVDLVRRKVTVIAANSQATVAAKAATTTIPIVFVTGADPVQVGFVASLNRPSGNLTGVASLDMQLGPKRLQLLHELLPNVVTMAALVNPTFPGSDIQARELQAAASTLGRQLHILRASTERDIEAAFATAAGLHAGGLVIGNDPFFNSWSERLAARRSATRCLRSMTFARSLRPAD